MKEWDSEFKVWGLGDLGFDGLIEIPCMGFLFSLPDLDASEMVCRVKGSKFLPDLDAREMVCRVEGSKFMV